MAQASNMALNAIKSQVNQLDNRIKTQVKKEIKVLSDKARNEVFALTQPVVYSVFKGVFDNYYGLTYDEDSLKDSISFAMTDNMKTVFTIDEKKFHFATREDRQEKKFNENESGASPYRKFRSREIETDTRRKIRNFFIEDMSQFDEANNMEEYDAIAGDIMDAFDNLSSIEQEEEIANIRLDFNSFKRENNPIISGVTAIHQSKVYAMAKTKALIEAEKIYKQVMKKYGFIQ